MIKLIPMAYTKKTDKCIPLYSKEQLSKEVIDFIKFAVDNCDVPCETSEIKTWGDELLKSIDKQN